MHLLSDIEEIADAPRRTITFWTEQGLLVPAVGTNRAGRGVHRQFSADEVVIACVMRALSQDHGVPIGRLLSVSRMMRSYLKTEGKVRKNIDQAISGEVRLFFILEPGDKSIGFSPFRNPG
jgi:DNA-binding transcriptional MerR regulator